MPPKKTSYDNISGQVRDQDPRFLTRYTRGVEGIFGPTGERVFLWTLQVPLTSREEVQDVYNRLTYLIESGVRLLPVIDYGVDRRGVAYLLTQWKKVEPVAIAARKHESPAALYSQIVAQVAKLHAGGMPFGDISEDSFLLDPLDRVVLGGIPAFGLPSPAASEQVQNYIAPEPFDNSKLPYEPDVYALGVYAHQLFTRRAFPKATSRKQMEEHLEVQTPTLLALYRNLPEWAPEVINGTLRWDPDERISMSELAGLAREQLGFGHRVALFFANLKNFRLSPRPRAMRKSVSSGGNGRAIGGSRGEPLMSPEMRNILLAGSALITLVLGLTFAMPKLQQTPGEDAPGTVSWNHGNTSEPVPAANVSTMKNALNGIQDSGDPVVSDPFGSRDPAKNSGITGKLNVFGSLGEETSELPSSDQNVFAQWAKTSRESREPYNDNAGSASSAPSAGADSRNTGDPRRVSTATSTNNVRLSVLGATPDRDLVALIKRAREIPADQFTTAARELLARNRLRLAPRLALLTLLRNNVKIMPPDRLSALLSVVDDRVRLSQLNVLSQWGAIEGALVLAALASQSWAPETTSAAFLTFVSTPVELEPLRTLITRVKRETWNLSIAEMRAVATVSLGPLAEKEDDEAAIKRLSQRVSPLELLLLLSGSLPRDEEAPWCPNFETTGV